MDTVSQVKDSFKEILGNKGRVLVVLAHPDDNEIICGGTVARLIGEGKRVRLVVTTNGGKGSRDKTTFTEKQLTTIRLKEQLRAGLVLGIPKKENFNLNIPDGELEANVENIKKIVFHIRQFKPDLVITQNPQETINTFSRDIRWINHRDHRHTGLITIDAAYPYAIDTLFFTDQLKEGLTPHRVSEFLFSDSCTHPEVKYFEVTDYLDQKKRALQQHRSVLPEEEVKGFIEEIKKENGSFEPLRYLKTT